MEKARLLWFSYRGQDDYVHFSIVKKLKDEGLISFFVAVGKKPRKLDSSVLDEPLYSHNDFLFAKYQVLLSDGIPLLDQEIYRLCSDFEGETLRMMDRLHGRGSENRSFDDFDTRRRMFLTHCSFWYNYLIDRQISHLVFIGVPHDVFTFVAYKVAHILGLQILILSPEKAGIPRQNGGIHYAAAHRQPSWTQSTFFVSESLEDIGDWNLSSELFKVGAKLKFHFLRDEFFFEPMLRNFSELQQQETIRNSRGFIPSLFVQLLSTPKKWFKLKELLKFRIISFKQRVLHNSTVRHLSGDHKSLLFCLSYQPEESTSPRAGIFVEQYFAIQALSVLLPNGWKVRVREHPDQYGKRRPRPKFFLNEISLLPRVEIVDLDESSGESLSRADAVSSATGTMAVEAWVKGIPVILLGKMWLKRAPGVFYIETIDDLKDAIQSICQGTKPSPEKIEAFKSWTISQSFLGSLGRIDPTNQELKSGTIQNVENVFRSWLSIEVSGNAKNLFK